MLLPTWIVEKRETVTRSSLQGASGAAGRGRKTSFSARKACIACLVAFVDQILQKVFVGGSVCKISVPPGLAAPGQPPA